MRFSQSLSSQKRVWVIESPESIEQILEHTRAKLAQVQVETVKLRKTDRILLVANPLLDVFCAVGVVCLKLPPDVATGIGVGAAGLSLLTHSFMWALKDQAKEDLASLNRFVASAEAARRAPEGSVLHFGGDFSVSSSEAFTGGIKIEEQTYHFDAIWVKVEGQQKLFIFYWPGELRVRFLSRSR
ncbi:MAG: hypothetical protein HY537_03075 [Deltaproteobacteria bacterium]|nr:hypothetical protein [Deltaproteobacteria bacterium]